MLHSRQCCIWFYYAVAKDIRWCQKSSFGEWNLLPTRNNQNNNFINFVSDKCAKKLVCNVSKDATMFCVSHHLVIFPEWKLGPVNLAIYSVVKYSKVISKECLQTLSHDNVLKDLASTTGFKSTIYRKLPEFIT